jgi:hypothetical protein
MVIFVKTVDLGSFTAAGTVLGLSSQMVGKHASLLEERPPRCKYAVSATINGAYSGNHTSPIFSLNDVNKGISIDDP